MAEKKVFKGLFPKHLIAQICSSDVWKDRIPHTNWKSHDRAGVSSRDGLPPLATCP